MTAHITTIGEIERVTGIDYLPGVAGSKRTAMENFKAPALWQKIDFAMKRQEMRMLS